MSRKNLGLGRTIRWAMLSAINRLYGNRSHFGTRRAHTFRLKIFAIFCRRNGINDVTDIKQSTLDAYCRYLAVRIDEAFTWPDGQIDGPISIAYAQNLMSTANTVMLALLGNSDIWVSPSKGLKQSRRFVRSTPVQAHEKNISQAARRIEQRGEWRGAAVVLLCYHWGMRTQEAALQNLDRMLTEAKKTGFVTILEGTKGGRKCPSRKIEATKSRLDALNYALTVRPKGSVCLLRPIENVRAFYQTIINRCRRTLKKLGIPDFRELRAAFAAEEYHKRTGFHPFSQYKPDRQTDAAARIEIARMLGHGRPFVCTSYIGGY